MRPELEEAIAASLADADAGGARPGGPPPAAMYAVRALRTEALTAERLVDLGGPGVECCVCRCGHELSGSQCSGVQTPVAFVPPSLYICMLV